MNLVNGQPGQLVERESGLLVTAALEHEPDRGKPGDPRGVCFDADGRRRLVITGTERKQWDRTVGQLAAYGVGFISICREDFKRPDGKTPCGQPMIPEGRGTPDDGYGCLCTRVHFA